MTLAGGLVLALLSVLWLFACLNGIGHGITPRQSGGDHHAPIRRGLVDLSRLKLRRRRGLPRNQPARPSTAPVSPNDP